MQISPLSISAILLFIASTTIADGTCSILKTKYYGSDYGDCIFGFDKDGKPITLPCAVESMCLEDQSICHLDPRYNPKNPRKYKQAVCYDQTDNPPSNPPKQAAKRPTGHPPFETE